jgi:hypothetical protein
MRLLLRVAISPMMKFIKEYLKQRDRQKSNGE